MSPPAPRRPVGAVLTVLATLAIALATLRTADPTAPPSPFLTCLVCGRTGALDVVLNLLLFVPLGAGLALLGRRARTAALLGLALSLFVETMQLLVFRGRDPSLSDLLTNTAGTALGWALARSWRGWLLPVPAAARRLALAAAAAWTALLAFTVWGLAPDAPGGPYVVHVPPPASEVARAFEGEILSRTLNGSPAGGLVADPALAAALRAPTLRLAAIVRPSYPPGMFRPIASVYTWDWRDVALLGQRHRNLVLRLRTRSARLRLPLPTLVVREAFPDPAAGGPVPTVRLVGDRTPAGLRVRAETDGIVREQRLPATPLVGWALLGSTLVPWDATGPLVTLLWAAAWLLPLGWWERRGWRGPPVRGAAAALAALAGATFLGGGAAPSAAEWLVVALAPALGWLAAGAVGSPRALAAGRDAGDTSPS